MILKRGLQLASRLANQLAVRGRLSLTVSQIHHNLGELDSAAAMATEAQPLHEDAHGESSPRWPTQS